jgi:hypothetical protein
MFVWGGFLVSGFPQSPADGALYDPATDVWRPISDDGAPATSGSAVWTAGEVLVFWAGPATADGHPDLRLSSYDPATDTWHPRPIEPNRVSGVQLWTGTKVLTWSSPSAARDGTIAGGIFEPATDTWTEIPPDGAPPLEVGFSAIWTGQDMIVWGGSEADDAAAFTDIGGRYTPR